MCLTVWNAAAVLDHRNGHPPVPGYTRTRHHIGHLGPGDLWCPDPEGTPHTVITVNRRAGRIVLTDQCGVAYHYLPGEVIGTAVPDPWIRTHHVGHRVTANGGHPAGFSLDVARWATVPARARR
jgi:hypothetical protein